MLPLRDENPAHSFPIITLFLIAANGYIFFQSLLVNTNEFHKIIFQYGIVPHDLSLHPLKEFTTLISAMFVHSGFGHLMGNMLYLWIFGNKMEDILGKIGFILFYSTCGIIASISHTFMDLDSKIPIIGASGAISGILGGYLILFPKARILTLVFLGFYFTIIRIPAVILLTLWIVVQIGNIVIFGADDNSGGVAWLAHISGFLSGIVIILLFLKKLELPKRLPKKRKIFKS